MANNYVSGSCVLRFPSDKAHRAIEVAKRVIEEIDSSDDDDEYLGCDIEFSDSGIWFHEMENFNPESIAAIASAVIDDLELDDVFVFSWSYSCSKARVDEFGGGVCAKCAQRIMMRGCWSYLEPSVVVWSDSGAHGCCLGCD